MLQAMTRTRSHKPEPLTSDQVDDRLEANAVKGGTRFAHGNVTSKHGGLLTQNKLSEAVERLAREPLRPLPKSLTSR